MSSSHQEAAPAERGGLSFVATSIQTADKGGYHYEERSLQHPVEQAGLTSNLPRDLEKLQQRDSTVGASTYSARRRENEEGENEDDFDNAVDNAPKGLDPEEYEFLTTIQQAQKKRAQEAAKREAQDKEQFMTAIASRTMRRQQYGADEEEVDYSKSSFDEAEAARLQREREERRRRLKEKMSQAQEKQSMLKKHEEQEARVGDKRDKDADSNEETGGTKSRRTDTTEQSNVVTSLLGNQGRISEEKDEEPAGALVAYGDSSEEDNDEDNESEAENE
eukprot:gb/GECG01011059.1/.p1 GENE.gb/GECG01011059.1/~~gb/GECG01011059.1/.p1  ORF type:complete len:277 (+),score=80.67 gb/GECG01011059.1/:1-831(+)